MIPIPGEESYVGQLSDTVWGMSDYTMDLTPPPRPRPPPRLPLLGAVTLVLRVMGAVLHLRLLVAEEVAPPAAGEPHLSGRPCALHLPHLLQGGLWGG